MVEHDDVRSEPPPSAAGPSRAAQLAGLVLVALSAAGMACFWSGDGDLGFQLATGREVLATGHIPSLNVLSYSEPTQPWRLHQWLPAVLFELVFRAGDIAGVILLKMLVVAAIWSVVYLTARSLDAGPRSSVIACLLAAAASAFRFECRPYLFTHLSLALIVLAAARYRGATSRRTAQRALLAATLTAAVACHLHAGAIDGLLALGLIALGYALRPVREHALAASRLSQAAHWALATLAGAVLGALTLSAYHPLGSRILTFPFEMGSDGYLAEHLVEFRTPWSFPASSLAAYWACLALWIVSLCTRARSLVHASFWLLGLVFAALSLRFVRLAFDFAIVAAPCIALALDRVPWPWRPRPALSVFALAALGLIAPLYTCRDRTPGFGYEAVVWPFDHFRFIRTHGLRGRAFLSDAWGGPFLGLFYPERQVFFDNRLEAYSTGFVRDVYQRIRYGQSGWDRLLDQYHVEFLLLRYTSESEGRLQQGRPNLRQLLARDARYTLVRFDDVGELFVRTRGANAELAERMALRGVDPDRRLFVGSPADAAPALLRALRAGERSATLLGMTAIAYADLGQLALARGFAREAARQAPDDPWTQTLEVRVPVMR